MSKLTKIKGIKPSGNYDGNYLYLFVSPKGKKVFRLKGYRFNGKEINQSPWASLTIVARGVSR